MEREDAVEHSQALTNYLTEKQYRWFKTSFDGLSLCIDKEAMQKIIFFYLEEIEK